MALTLVDNPRAVAGDAPTATAPQDPVGLLPAPVRLVRPNGGLTGLSYRLAVQVMAETSQTPAAREGVAAFLGKRRPAWGD